MEKFAGEVMVTARSLRQHRQVYGFYKNGKRFPFLSWWHHLVARVRDVGNDLEVPLDVVIDSDPHGNILGLPFAKSPTRKLAERIASLLAKSVASPQDIRPS